MDKTSRARGGEKKSEMGGSSACGAVPAPAAAAGKHGENGGWMQNRGGGGGEDEGVCPAFLLSLCLRGIIELVHSFQSRDKQMHTLGTQDVHI